MATRTRRSVVGTPHHYPVAPGLPVNRQKGTPGKAPWPRTVRARNRTVTVDKIAPGAWVVPSHTTLGQLYRFTQQHDPRLGVYFTCTCSAGQHRERMGPAASGLPPVCSHGDDVFAAEKADGYPPRPTGPAHVAALVD
jgi:hypothetical protein